MILNQLLISLYGKLPVSAMIKKIGLLSLVLLFCLQLLGQTEAEIQDQANKLFRSEKYIEATPLYLRLLALSPRNSDYNYRYGTCLLFNSDKKKEALRYLKFATDNPPIEPLAYYFLGKAYHTNYLFNDAVRSYEKFTSIANPKEAVAYPTSRLVETCQNGRRLLMNYSEMIVFDKKEIEFDKFFRLYDLKEIGGSITVVAEYQSKIDKKYGHMPLVFFPKNATEIYYSSYGDSENQGKQIYRRKKAPTGAWGEPELIKGKVNTQFDEDFCYRSQDGKYLYFSSKGHNSMGGYDVFRSEYDQSTDSFLEPENMDFAISSPDDDIFFLVDAKNENGYFASSRQSEVGKLFVYKIRVDKLPAQLSIIAGRYESKISPKPARLQVQVENALGELLGTFNSNDEGQIVISFPNAGQYKYKMNLQGSTEIFTANVNVPSKKDIKPIRQSFVHFLENGKEVVRVMDRFDEAVTEKDEILATVFADKAVLNPNADKFDINSLKNAKMNTEILAEVGADGLSLSEVANEMESKAETIRRMENEAKAIEQKAAALIAEETKKVEDFNKKLAENAAAYRAAVNNSMSKQNLLEESKELLAEKAISEEKIENLLEINKRVQSNLSVYQSQKQRALDWEKKGAELQQLLREDKSAEALQLIALNKNVVKSAMEDTIQNYQTTINGEINNLNQELTTLNSRKFNYQTSSKDLQNNIDYMERFLLDGKAEDPKATKENIALKKKDLATIQQEIKNIDQAVIEKRERKEFLIDELSEYNELDSRPLPAQAIQFQTAKDKWLATKNAAQNKEADYLAAIIEKGEDGTTIASIETPSNATVAKKPEEILSNVHPTYSKNKEEILANNNLSELEKANQLSSLEQNNLALLKEEIKQLDQELATNPSNAIAKEEKANVQGLMQKSTENLQNYSATLDKERSKEIAQKLTAEKVAENVDKTYDEVVKHILEESNQDPLSQLKSLNEHDQNFISKMEQREAEIKQKANLEPNRKPEFDRELALLAEMKSDKKEEIENRSSQILNLETVAATSPLNPAFAKMGAKEQERTLLNQLDPSYIAQKEKFEEITDRNIDSYEAERKADQKLVKDLEANLTKMDPQRQKAEIETIQRLLNDARADIAASDAKISELINIAANTPVNTFENQTPEEQENEWLEKLNAQYVANKEVLANDPSNSKEKVEALLKLDQGLLKTLLVEKAKLNPATQTAELNALNRVEEKIKTEIFENELNLQAVSETNEELVSRLLPNYETKLSGAEANTNELEKNRALVNIDAQAIQLLQKEKNKLDLLAEQNPKVESLRLKLEQLTELIDEKSQLMASREERVKELETELANTNVTVNPTVNAFDNLTAEAQENAIKEKLNWNLESQKETIAQGNQSEEEKVRETIALDKNALKLLLTEKAKLNAETQKTEMAAIERIEKDIQSSLSNNQMNLLALPETSEQLINRLAKNDAQKRNEIANNSNLNEADKIELLMALDEALVKTLETEKDKFNRLGKVNPQIPSLLAKANEIDEVINAKKAELTQNKEELARLQDVASNNTNPTNPIIETPNTFAQLPEDKQEEQLLNELAPNYLAEKEKFEKTIAPSKTELQKAIERDQALLSALATQKEQLNPSSQKAEIEAVSRIENEVQTALESNQLKEIAWAETPTELLNRIAKDPLSDLAALKNNSQMSAIQKAEKEIEIKESVVAALEKEKSVLTTFSTSHPSNEGLTQKLAAVQDAISSQNEEIAQLENELEKFKTELANVNPNLQPAKSFNSVDELRTEFLSLGSETIEAEIQDLEGLKNQVKALEEYEKDLQVLDSNYQYLESAKGENHTAERTLIAEELNTVAKKKRTAMITIGEIETELMAASSPVTKAKYENEALQRMVEEENELRKALEAEVSLKEARKMEKELIAVIAERMDKENAITQNLVSDINNENEDKLKLLKSLEGTTATERLSLELTENKYEELNEKAQDLEQKAKKAKSEPEQAELLAQALALQEEASDLLEISYVDTKIDRLTKGKIGSLLTNAELEMRRRNLLIEESNQKAKIEALDEQIKLTTNEKEQEKLIEERRILSEEMTQINNELAKVDNKLSVAPQKGEQTLTEEAKNTELTYVEERQIAESKTYKELSSASYDAQFLEREIAILLKSIDKEKGEAMKLVEESMTDPTAEIDELIALKVESIQTKENRLNELKMQLLSKQNEIQQKLPANPDQAAKVLNLLARGVDPMSKSDLMDYIPIPEGGFAINKTASQAAVPKPIEAESQKPTGLMYRVQVGAFSKPVAETEFNEFTPVSAEKRDNGIIVYMAGYFEGNTKAYDAQRSIRDIGYKDAFVVAYCGGKRITLAEAKRLEETNACAPIQLNQLAIQAQAPLDTTKVMITELDYYKGIGAAPAIPVETKKGLFYTVQLGVFNKPATKSTLKDMSPLITKRLPNGQIRYSAGVYVSIEEAMPKRQQAFDRGISDAYITVYYNGERITLTEAEKLLQENGTQIIEKTAIGIIKDVESRLKAEKKLEEDIKQIVQNKLVEGMNVQLVSKNQYQEFPRDILNRFNSHATFYYDINDKRIKSNLYKQIEDIPQIYFLRNELDTVYVSDVSRMENAKQKDLRNVVFEISSTQMDGDLTDYLLRLNYRKEFILEGSVVKVILHEVPTDKVQDISDRLRTLKIRSEVVDPALGK